MLRKEYYTVYEKSHLRLKKSTGPYCVYGVEMSGRRIYIAAAALFVLVLSCLFFSGCGDNAAESGKITVAVTIVPEETFVRAVCGDLVNIITLVPPGSSPETYEPSPKTMEDLGRASVYFSIGVPAEESYILPLVGNVKIVSLAERAAAVYPDRLFEEGGRDPHVWLSPKRVIVMIDTIAVEMGALDPENKELYLSNAQSYIKQIEDADSYIKAAFEGKMGRSFIAFHPAFGYFADDYGLTMYSLEEEGKAVTARHIKDMADLAKTNNIKVIYYQAETDGSQSEAFAQEIGGAAISLAPLSADYTENLKLMADTMAENMK